MTDHLARIGELARDLLPRYGFSPRAQATLINHSENATYRIDDPEQAAPAILRIHRRGYHTKQAIRSELHWLEALGRHEGIVTARAIPARDGSLIQSVSSARLPEPRHAAMFTFLSGVEPSEDDLIGPFERLGTVSAHMHDQARNWTLPDGFTRQVWDHDGALGQRSIWGRWQNGIGVTPAREQLFARLSETIHRRLEQFGRARNRFGLVHADIRLANLLVEDDVTKVIDFDDCGFGWFLYDIGTALSFIEHRPDVPELVAAWLRGYRKVAQLSAADEAEIPTFIMLRRLLLVAWIGSHHETDLAQSMGAAYTAGSCDLAEAYLSKFG
ncbi:MAG TPA: phosphotransferase [Terriglobales bacterium]|nr:phosphotransferase [Terriglobales bacterium]